MQRSSVNPDPGRPAPARGRYPAAMPPARLRLPVVLLLLTAAIVGTGCGRGSQDSSTTGGPSVGVKGSQDSAAKDLGFPAFATKNTVRVGGADPIADAAATARHLSRGSRRACRGG